MKVKLASWEEADVDVTPSKTFGGYTLRPSDKWDPAFDFFVCAEHHPPPFNLEDIEAIECLQVGANDEADWHWRVRVRVDKLHVQHYYVVGGCDFTGWDCQSWAEYTALPKEFDEQWRL